MRLVAFDFDGTLSPTEMTVPLGERRQVGDEMAEITERAMNDELEYAESLRRRVALLEGLSLEEVDEAFAELSLRSGAPELLEALQAAGVVTAILTGGFERGVRAALDRAGVGVDVIIANRLLLDGEYLSGEVDGQLVETDKGDRFRALLEEYSMLPSETIAVGDGANDREMLNEAGLGVCFRPKPTIRPVCDETVDEMSELRALLADRGVLDPPSTG